MIWFCRKTLFACGGWLLAILLACLIAPRIYHRVWLQLPSVQRQNWEEICAEKRGELAQTWQDHRPLIIMAGDSHVEMGNWYDLFRGAFAIRNCGLSQSKIADVADMVPAIKEPKPGIIVLMCGVNSLAHKEPVAACIQDYDRLLTSVGSMLHPHMMLVLSVMPVRQTAVDQASHELNRQIEAFNRQLKDLCRRHHAEFLDVNPAVTDDYGGLASRLTVDGLHLNRQGYKKLADVLAPKFAEINLSPIHEQPETQSTF